MPDPSVASTPATHSLPDRIRRFLERPRYAVLATVDPEGRPHQAFVWYLLTHDGIVINSRRERRWPRNLLVDPHIAIAIQDADAPDEWIGIKGTAELLRDGDAATEDIMAMAHRYGSNPEKYRGQDRLSFLVRVERTFEYR